MRRNIFEQHISENNYKGHRAGPGPPLCNKPEGGGWVVPRTRKQKT